MTREEFNDLKPGDIVCHAADGDRFIVTGNYGNRVTAAATADMTNPGEWDKVWPPGKSKVRQRRLALTLEDVIPDVRYALSQLEDDHTQRNMHRMGVLAANDVRSATDTLRSLLKKLEG